MKYRSRTSPRRHENNYKTIQKQPFLNRQEGLSHVRSFMREFGFQFQLEYVRQFFMSQLGEVRLFDVCPGP